MGGAVFAGVGGHRSGSGMPLNRSGRTGSRRFAGTVASVLLSALWGVACNPPVNLQGAEFTVVDAETGQPVPCRVSLWKDDQPVILPGYSSYSRGSEHHFLVSGSFLVELDAAASYRMTVERGLEYHPEEHVWSGTATGDRTIRLRRWVDMNRQGWYSADLHVHRDPADIPQILQAEDLNFVPTITYHVWSERVSTPFPGTADFPVRVDERRFFTANAQEVERIQGGPGAVILLARELPIPFDGYEYYPPAIHFTRRTHEQGGYVEGDKLFWLDTIVNVALGQIDFIELNCNHFLPREVETDLSPWSHWPQELGFRGNQGFALWMMESYYRLLNCGFELPLSAGSACGVKATPVGYNRVYVYLADVPLDYDNLLQALKRGRSFSTNGPLIDFRLDGEMGPGRKLTVEPGRQVLVEALVKSKSGLSRVEFVRNGEVIHSVPGDGQLELQVKLEIPVQESCWIAVRAFEDSTGTVRFGHTSPAWVQVGGHGVRVPRSARRLMAMVDELIAYTEAAATFTEPSHRKETLDLYRQARAIYARLAGVGSDAEVAGR